MSSNWTGVVDIDEFISTWDSEINSSLQKHWTKCTRGLLLGPIIIDLSLLVLLVLLTKPRRPPLSIGSIITRYCCTRPSRQTSRLPIRSSVFYVPRRRQPSQQEEWKDGCLCAFWPPTIQVLYNVYLTHLEVWLKSVQLVSELKKDVFL